MAVEAKQIGIYIRKGVFYSIRTGYRTARDYPFAVGVVLFAFLLYKFLPSLFGLLVSSSPVIFCTAVLLGTLLSFGQPNIPEVEEEEKSTHEISSLKARAVGDDIVIKKDESFAVETHVETRREPDPDESVISSTTHEVEEHNEAELISRSVVIESKERAIHGESKTIEEREYQDNEFIGRNELHSIGKDIDEREYQDNEFIGRNKLHSIGKDTEDHSTDDPKKELVGPEVELHAAVGESLEAHLDGHDDGSSDSSSDCAESSSPDASMADVMPMLDELHPLLDSEAPQPILASLDDSDSESDELAGVAENPDEEEAPEDQKDASNAAVTWTEDDEKNLIDVGTSELERNQRLENLIAKRIAQKNRIAEARKKNLIDLEGNGSTQISVPIIEEMSRIRIHVPSLNTTRRNPFDHPYDSDEIAGLPPIPGSAPPGLLPRRNPFDLPYDTIHETSKLVAGNSSHLEFMTLQQREMYFRGQESSSLGVSKNLQEQCDSRLPPYFVAEHSPLGDTEFAAFQQESIERSDSKESSVLETHTVSSVVDQEDEKDTHEEQMVQQHQSIIPEGHTAEAVARESESSEEEDSMEIDSNVSNFVRGSQDAFKGAAEEIAHEQEISSPTSSVITETAASPVGLGGAEAHVKSEAVAENYSVSSSCLSSLTSNEKNLKMNVDKGSGSFDETGIDSPRGSHESLQITLADDGSVKEPVYDSSPSAIGKSFSGMTAIADASFPVDKEMSNPASSAASSETHVEIREGILPSMAIEQSTSTRDEEVEKETASGIETSFVASSNLCAVDQNESRSMKVTEVREDDIVQVGFSGLSIEPCGIVEGVLPSIPAEQSTSTGDGNVGKETVSGNETSFVASSDLHSADQYESRSLEVSEVDEANVVQIGFSGIPMEPNVIMESKVKEAFEDLVSTSSENVSAEAAVMDKGANHPFEKAQVPINGSDLGVHVVETLVDVVEKTDTVTSTAPEQLLLADDSTSPALQPMEVSTILPSSEGNRNESEDDSSYRNEWVHEADGSTSSKVSPSIPAPDYDDSTAVHALELNESPECSSTVEMKSEEVLENNTNSNKLKEDMQNGMHQEQLNGSEEIHLKEIIHDGVQHEHLTDSRETILEYIRDEDFEEVDGIKEIDEGLLSELDAVGDFSVNEHKSDVIQSEKQIQSDSDVLMDSLVDVGVKESLPELQVLETELVANVGNLQSPTEVQLAVDQPQYEVGSSELKLSGQVPILEKPSSELQILKAEPVQYVGVEGNLPAELQSAVDVQKSEIMPSQLELSDQDLELKDPTMEQPIFEATAVEHIGIEGSHERLAELQMAVELPKSEVGTNRLEPSDRDPELTESTSELQVLQDRSLPDIDLAFKQVHDREVENSIVQSFNDKPLVMETYVDPTKIERTKGDGDLVETASELQVLEASSLEDISSAFKQLHERDLVKSIYHKQQLMESTSVLGDEHLNLPKPTITDTEGSSTIIELVKGDTDLVETGPELHVLEANSLEDIDLAFKQFCEGDFEKSAINERQPVESEIGPYASVPDHKHPVPIETNVNELVLDADSLEDAASLKQLSERNVENKPSDSEAIEGHVEPLILSQPTEEIEANLMKSMAVETSKPDDKHPDPVDIHSDIEVLEASSLEDIHAVLKRLSEGNVESKPKHNPEAAERHLGPFILSRSPEEIEANLKKSMAVETGANMEETGAGKSNGVKVSEGSSSSVPASRERRKKKSCRKSGSGSGSSSSSSSSSSDSD